MADGAAVSLCLGRLAVKVVAITRRNGGIQDRRFRQLFINLVTTQEQATSLGGAKSKLCGTTSQTLPLSLAEVVCIRIFAPTRRRWLMCVHGWHDM
jgi:hypothetical protein